MIMKHAKSTAQGFEHRLTLALVNIETFYRIIWKVGHLTNNSIVL
jgi:hypothetical protein